MFGSFGTISSSKVCRDLITAYLRSSALVYTQMKVMPIRIIGEKIERTALYPVTAALVLARIRIRHFQSALGFQNSVELGAEPRKWPN